MPDVSNMSRPAGLCCRALLFLMLFAFVVPAPALAKSGDKEFVQVVSSGDHSLAVGADGSVWSWGRDHHGQLGNDAVLADQSSPVRVAGLSDVRHVATGYDHSVAVKADGTVWTWGYDSAGQLGDDAALVDQSLPVQVAGLTGVRSVAASGDHTLAVKTDGTVWAWGYDSEGQLGNDAALASQPTPVQVAGLTGVDHVAAGWYHSVAVKLDGTVWSWGRDTEGQLGDDAALVRQPTPVAVAGLANIREVAANGSHSLVIRADGTAWSWGRDTYGQLGDDAALVNQPTPVQVAGVINVQAVAAGGSHSVVVGADGTTWSWGSDAYGELGNDAPLLDRPTAVQVAGLSNVVGVTAGSEHAIAVHANGSITAWGQDLYGQLGDGAPLTDQPTPVAVALALPCSFVQVVAGAHHTLALKADGTVWAWGMDAYGQLGNDAALADRAIPVQVLGLASVRQIAAGEFHSVALRADGTVWTWGLDSSGQLGNDAALVSQPLPVQVPGLASIRQVGAGANHTVALRGNGTMMAWGWDANGQLGDDAPRANQPTPVVTAGIANVRQIAAGVYHTIVVRSDGRAFAWGNDGAGQLGDDAPLADQPLPVQVAGLISVRQVDGGSQHSLALLGDGSMRSWGWDAYGQLGDDVAIANQPIPVTPTGLGQVLRIDAGYYHSMAAMVDGATWAWGHDVNGQVGNGAPTATEPVPVPVAGGLVVRALAGGANHSVAVRPDGVIVSWGWDGYGQLGNGLSLVDTTSPSVVRACNAAPPEPLQVAPEPEGPQMRISVDGVPLWYGFVNVNVATDYSTPIPAVAGPRTIHVMFSGNDFNPGPSGTLDRNLYLDYVTLQSSGTKLEAESGTIVAGGVSLDGGASGGAYVGHAWGGSGGTTLTTTTTTADTSLTVRAWASTTPSILTTTTPTLTARFLDSDEADSGRLEFQLCADVACGSVLQSGSSAGGLSNAANGSWMIPTALNQSTKYWWRARSVDANGATGSYFTPSPIYINEAPDPPTLTTPADGSTTASTTPTLRSTYQDAGNHYGSTTYRVCSIADCSAVGDPVATGTTATISNGQTGAWTITPALAAGTWYWSARSQDAAADMQSAWTASRTLTVGTPSMTLSLDAASLDLGSMLPGDDRVGVATLQVTTNNATGYTLRATDLSDANGMLHAGGVHVIPDWTGTPATPTTWPAGTSGAAGYHGVSVVSATGGKDVARWGSGTTATDFAGLRFAGLKSGTPTILHARPGYSAGADAVQVSIRSIASSSTPSGAYEGTVTFTAVANP